MSTVQLDLELLRTNCEEEFQQWFSDFTALASEPNTLVSTPRITSRQVHRSNASAEGPESYYRRNIMIDHITLELEERFRPVHQTKVKLLGLVPSAAATYSVASVAEVGALYSADLPSEFSRWKRACASTPVDKRADTLEKALLFCDRDDISVLLAIACTLPVTTCETEIQQSTQTFENLPSFNHDRGKTRFTCCNQNTP